MKTHTHPLFRKPKPKLGPLVVPAEYQGRTVAILKSHDRLRWVLVAELPAQAGWSVLGIVPKQRATPRRAAVPQTAPAILAQWKTPTPTQSVVPTQILHTALRDVAVRWAKRFAKTNTPPTPREQRRWRRKAEQFALRVHQGVLAALPKRQTPHDTNGKPTTSWATPQPKSVFICVFDPRAHRRPGRRTFQIHTASCDRLDHVRGRAVRGGGWSWIVSADSQTEARRKQLAAFTADGKRYHYTDFEIHECKGPDTGHKGVGKR